MRSQDLFAIALVVFVAIFHLGNAAELDSGLISIPRIPDPALIACRAECSNHDGDDLYPGGTFSESCAQKCRGNVLAAPPNPGVRPSGNNRAFILLESMTYLIGNTNIGITVPVGFVTDYASIPRRLWSLYSPHDQYSRAAIVHDYLYWSQLCTREQADNLFMIAMKESAVPAATREIVYFGVHEGGQSSWDDNAKERQKGLLRVVPIERKDFPPNWSWEMYREYLGRQGVKDPSFQGADYCELGITKDLPLAASGTAKQPPQPKLGTRALRGMDRFRLMVGPSN